jgi:hypothetical protein
MNSQLFLSTLLSLRFVLFSFFYPYYLFYSVWTRKEIIEEGIVEHVALEQGRFAVPGRSCAPSLACGPLRRARGLGRAGLLGRRHGGEQFLEYFE